MGPSADNDILRRIARAKSLYEASSKELLQDPKVTGSLTKYRQAITRTGGLMREMGIHHACARCGTEGPGSCCFLGIEEGYDNVLLLINLLLGISIPDIRELRDSCFFVGSKGCRLEARYYYCIHYLCPELQDTLVPASVKRLLRTVGEELQACWELEQVLRAWFKNRGLAA